MSQNSEKILVALDYPDLASAMAVARRLRGKTGFKVGMQLNTAEGTPTVIKEVGENVFLDLKFHDIPNTVAEAVKAAATHRVKMLNVHCLGGVEMMTAASKASAEILLKTRGYRPLVIGVTILTSHDRKSLDALGIDPGLPVAQIVQKLSVLALESGLDGVVCSPQEIPTVRQAVPNRGFLIVTPGIRKKTSPPDDQKRTLPAGEAIRLGADYLVIGRPITAAADPVAAAEEFAVEIDEALAA